MKGVYLLYLFSPITMEEKTCKYTCEEYRREMTLLALKMRLSSPGLSEKEEKDILNNIREIEISMRMD